MKVLAFHIIIVVICTSIVGCRKHDNGPVDFGQGTGNCRLSALGDSAYNKLLYDRYSRLTSIGNTTLTYHGDIVVATHAGPGYALPYGYRVDSFELNGRGQIACRFGIPAEPGVPTAYDEYNYDSLGQLKAIARYNNGTPAIGISYKWANGDMIEEDGANGHHYYKYDTTRKWQLAMPGNLNSYVFFGLPKYRPLHLVVQDSIPDLMAFSIYLDNYTYEFDNAGKIITCTNTSNWHNTYVVHYKYDCYSNN